MTTQRQLLALGRKHEAVPAVRIALQEITEAQMRAAQNLATVQGASTTLLKAAAFEDGYSVSLDHSDLVTAAAKASTALSRISHGCTSLACVLESIGVNVSY